MQVLFNERIESRTCNTWSESRFAAVNKQGRCGGNSSWGAPLQIPPEKRFVAPRPPTLAASKRRSRRTPLDERAAIDAMNEELPLVRERDLAVLVRYFLLSSSGVSYIPSSVGSLVDFGSFSLIHICCLNVQPSHVAAGGFSERFGRALSVQNFSVYTIDNGPFKVTPLMIDDSPSDRGDFRYVLTHRRLSAIDSRLAEQPG